MLSYNIIETEDGCFYYHSELEGTISEFVDIKKEEVMKDFTKKDLKDGMTVEYRDYDGFQRVVVGDKIIKVGRSAYLRLDDFNKDLSWQKKYPCEANDIMKVSYMGEVLWEREEWVDVTPLEALRALAKKGEPLKARVKDDLVETWSHRSLIGVYLGVTNYPFRGMSLLHRRCQLKKGDLA